MLYKRQMKKNLISEQNPFLQILVKSKGKCNFVNQRVSPINLICVIKYGNAVKLKNYPKWTQIHECSKKTICFNSIKWKQVYMEIGCCVFQQAFGCCTHQKAGQKKFWTGLNLFLLFCLDLLCVTRVIRSIKIFSLMIF